MNQPSSQEIQAARANKARKIAANPIQKSKYYVRISEANLKVYLAREYGDSAYVDSIIKAFPRAKNGAYLGDILSNCNSGFKIKTKANQFRDRVAVFCGLSYLNEVFVYRGSEILK